MKNTLLKGYANRSAGSVVARVFVLLVVGVLFYAMNCYTPLFADDYSYSFSFATGERIGSVADIIESQIAHYRNTNGRFVTHFFAQLFLLMGKPVFNCINVVVFLLLGVLICFHAKGAFARIAASDLIIAYAILFLSVPAFGQSFLWLDGSATYSLGIVIAFAYLIPFRRMIEQVHLGTYVQGSALTQAIKFLYTFVLGILAGNVSENVGAALIIFILLCEIYVKYHKIKLQLWMLGLGNMIGTILAVASPGTQSRLNGAGGLSVLGTVKNSVFIGANFLEYLQLPLCIFVALLIAYLVSRKNTPAKEGWEYHAILAVYIVSMFAAAFSMILSPQFPSRAWSIVSAIAAVVVVRSLATFAIAIPGVWRIRIVLATMLIVLAAGAYVNGIVRIRAMYDFHQTRIEAIETAVLNGEKSVEVSAIASDSTYSVFDPIGDLNWDSSAWPNADIARYYGIDEIVRASQDFDN